MTPSRSAVTLPNSGRCPVSKSPPALPCRGSAAGVSCARAKAAHKIPHIAKTINRPVLRSTCHLSLKLVLNLRRVSGPQSNSLGRCLRITGALQTFPQSGTKVPRETFSFVKEEYFPSIAGRADIYKACGRTGPEVAQETCPITFVPGEARDLPLQTSTATLRLTDSRQ